MSRSSDFPRPSAADGPPSAPHCRPHGAVSLGAVARRQPSPAGGGGAAPPFDRALLDKYCVTCHNERRKARPAGLALDQIDATNIGDNAPVWEKVVVKASEPRDAAGRITPARRGRLQATRLPPSKTALDRGGDSRPNPGRIAVHRLNRTEYANAIRDMLALEVDAQTMLRPDETGYGFDNIADVLTISPGLMEEYKLAAWKISRLAVGDPTIRPSVATYKVSRFLDQEYRVERGPAVRLARRHGHQAHLPARRRVRRSASRCSAPTRRTSSRG